MKRIPFRADMLQLVKTGRKTATTRTRRYGEVGDVLECKDGLQIQLTAVQPMPLGSVATHCYLAEGFESPEAFIAAWKDIYPKRGFRAGDIIYYHVFKKVDR